MIVLIQWKEDGHKYTYPVEKLLKRMKLDVTQKEIEQAAKELVKAS